LKFFGQKDQILGAFAFAFGIDIFALLTLAISPAINVGLEAFTVFFFASRLLAVTALEVSSVLGINFGSEGVRVAFLGCADGLVANIRELLRVLAVGALAVSTHHQRSETLAV